MPQIINNTHKRIKQDNTKSNVLRKRNLEDGKIDFRMTSRSIYNLVRGLTKPYAGAHIEAKGKKILVWKVKEIKNNQKNIEPGKVIEVMSGSFIVKSYTNAVEIINHDFNILPKKGDYL